jgi:hypothetical protein
MDGADEQERVAQRVASRRIAFGDREGERAMLGDPELVG